MASMPRATLFMYESVNAGPSMGGAVQTYSMTETHWYKSTNAQLTDVLAAALDLASIRQNLLGVGSTLTHVRVSYDDTYRDSLLRPVKQSKKQQFPQEGSQPGTVQNAPDMPWSDILVRCESGSLYRKSLYLAGIPDDAVTNNGFQPQADWTKAWKTYVDELKLNWGWKATNRGANTSGQVIAVTAQGGNITFNVPGLTVQVGDKIQVSGAIVTEGTIPINGAYIVNAVNGTNITCWGGNPSPSYLGGGKARVISNKIIVPYTDLHLQRPCERKRGGLSSAPRGRRRKKK